MNPKSNYPSKTAESSYPTGTKLFSKLNCFSFDQLVMFYFKVFRRFLNPTTQEILDSYKDEEDTYKMVWRYPLRQTKRESIPLDYFNKDFYKPKYCKKFLPSLRSTINQKYDSLDDYNNKTNTSVLG